MATLSLCMIVRDNEGTIRPCLESIRPWVDELIVVDTGSRDSTPRIAVEFGARLFTFPWCDDFSAARNASLSHARGQWVFWMDSDDTIDQDNGRKLRALANQPCPQSTLGYVMQVHCPNETNCDVTVVDHVKMFRNSPQIRFEFRIHEQVLQSIRRLGGDVAWTDIFVVHSGADHSAKGRKRKYERDLRILAQELERLPDHPFVLFNLGMTHADMENHAPAITYLTRCLEVSRHDESHVRKAFALLVSALERALQPQEALEACERGLQQFPKDIELWFRRGLLNQHLGRLSEAEEAYLKAVTQQEERHFTSVDPGVSGFKARHNLALVYQDMNRFDLAETQLRNALRENPGHRPSWYSLGECLVRQRRFDAAELQIERMLADNNARCDGLVMQSLLAEARGDLDSATACLEAAIQEFPSDLRPRQSYCRLLFEHELVADAEAALQDLISLQPDDASAHHNLGTLYLRRGNFQRAAEEYRRSLELRPSFKPTADQLALAEENLRNS